MRLPPNNNYQIQLTHSVLKMTVDSSLSKSQGIILTTTVLYGIILTKKMAGILARLILDRPLLPYDQLFSR